MTIATKPTSTSTGGEDVTLYASVELGSTGWLLTTQASSQSKARRTKVKTDDWRGLVKKLAEHRAAAKAGPIACCYEAGREGFWLWRALTAAGIRAGVLDPASVPVNQRRRRTKTDRIDGERELDVYWALCEGRRTTGRLVVVPSEEQEDARQITRTRDRLVKERTAAIAYIKSALVRVGADLPTPLQAGWLEHLADVRTWDDKPLPRNLRRDIELMHERLTLIERQIKAIENELQVARHAMEESTVRRRRKTREAADSWAGQASEAERRMGEQMALLCRLKGIGDIISSSMAAEVFWRDFHNRRQVGGYLGFAPTEFSSAAESRELGISKAGNRRARSIMIEAAWIWQRSQPHSTLTHWFLKRAPKGCASRRRRVAIVAMARKLTVALWRYLSDGVVPEGATMRT